jgi:hypothetical protein
MSKTLIEDIFNQPEWEEEIATPATDRDLLILTEQFLQFEIPTNVFLQAMAIAAYDCASALRYAENYITLLKKKNKRKKVVFLRSVSNFENN